ncbi:haloperoxidase [Ktedonobacter robiniae]|uniref:Haloperoxidase n=1 Tax=Ktedonobacter robiniae TaxID=2778365 RepID=A0ABQ3V494_9CHLR|nr:haloperoxidase [Ktedonobacter robiniae]
MLKVGVGGAVAAVGSGAWLGYDRSIALAKQGGGGNTGTDNIVIQWNKALLQAIRDTNPGPTVASRALAIVHTCMYDAWTAYDRVALPTQRNGLRKQRQGGKNWKSIELSVSYAAYHALVDLFPSQTPVFDIMMRGLGYDPGNTCTDPTNPSGIGNVAARAVLSYRSRDGSNQLNGYVDTSHYIPVNSPDALVSPLHWQPLRVNGIVQKFTTPHWGTIAPFALSSGKQFRPPGPVMDSASSAYRHQAETIVRYSATLNNTMKTIADYWANGPNSETPPGHWALFCQFLSAHSISRKNKHDIGDDIKMFFALSNALFDASIACWDAKRAYDYVRPISAVRYLYAGKPLVCWGGVGKGTVTMPDGAHFLPYQESSVVTPPFPEYVSGHSTFSAAGAYILRQIHASDRFGDSFTAAPGSSLIEPGLAPKVSVTLFWPTFSAAADEAGLSRQYGGIHFNQADHDGRTLGRQVAIQVWQKAEAFINGTL